MGLILVICLERLAVWTLHGFLTFSIGFLIFPKIPEHSAASSHQHMFSLKLRTAVLVTGTGTRTE